MSTKGKRKFVSIVDAVIDNKKGIKESTIETIKDDAAAILESIVGELSEEEIAVVLDNQGFTSHSYLSTVRALKKVAVDRKLERNRNRD